MTITSAIGGQLIGLTNKGEGQLPYKLTLQASTTAFVISGRITNVTTNDPKKITRVWYSTSSYNFTTAQAIKYLRATARYVDVRPIADSGTGIVMDSSLEPVTGNYLYLWCEIPADTVDQVIDVNIIELP